MAQSLPRRIVVLLHARDHGAERRPYQLWDVVDVWRRWGIEVSIVHGVDRAIDAEIVINHLDVTVVPEPYAVFMARYPVSINARCLDLSKRATSSNVLTEGDPWPGPFIVKTDRNHGGRQEWRLEWGRLGLLFNPDAWWPYGRWGSRSMLLPHAYPIFESAAAIPPAIWRNPRLVVERFVPERDGNLFAMRSLEFFGEYFVNHRRLSTSPIVKANTVVRSEAVDPHPGVLAAARRLHLDRGKIDYVVRDGRADILDVNRTNTVATYTRARRAETGRRFADGLWNFWPPNGGS